MKEAFFMRFDNSTVPCNLLLCYSQLSTAKAKTLF